MVYGRLSDIFGRKVMLAVATGFLAFGNLLAGFAKTPVELYIFRAIGGMGGQGINSIAMVIVSRAVPTRRQLTDQSSRFPTSFHSKIEESTKAW